MISDIIPVQIASPFHLR